MHQPAQHLKALVRWAVVVSIFFASALQVQALQCAAVDLHPPAPAPALPASCDSAAARCPVLVDGPKIITMTDAVARGPDAFFHLRADAPSAQLELRAGGELVAPLFEDEPALGALYALPAGAPGCPLAVSIAARGGLPSDCKVLQVPHAQFEEIARPAGIAVLHNTEDEVGPEMPASPGLAFGDFDNYGDADFYLANFGLPGILFRNNGPSAQQIAKFTDISAAAGIDGVFRGSAAMFVDIDGDGDLDLYIGRDGPDHVHLNQLVETGTVRFEEAGVKLGLSRAGERIEDSQRTTGMAFGDYDQDGRLDLYRTTHITYSNTAPDMHQDHLFWNAGDRFVEVTELLDNKSPATRMAAFAAVWLDVDRDGDADLVVASDHDSFSPKTLARPNVL